MIIAKLTLLLTVIIIISLIILRIWCENHKLEAMVKDYPWWSYIIAYAIVFDAIGIIVSIVLLLFFYQ